VRRRAALALLLLPALLPALAAEPLAPGRFSALAPGGLPEGWEPFSFSRFPRHTVYRLAAGDGVTVLRAEADASVSALLRPFSADPRAYPLMRWRWKVENLLEKGDIRRREGDDFPARIYVLFDYDPERLSFADRAKILLARVIYGARVPAAALCYVWDSRAAPGTIVPNAYTDRVRMVVVRSGAADLGRWVAEERDLARDFRAAFGEDPPAISGIAIAADTDNTGERAVAWFGDITLHPGPP
jgi:hypothetical protein